MARPPYTRPFTAAKVTNKTGTWTWVGNPQAILVNGKGFYGDCQVGGARVDLYGSSVGWLVLLAIRG